jgi:hypothetical protein
MGTGYLPVTISVLTRTSERYAISMATDLLQVGVGGICGHLRRVVRCPGSSRPQ